MSDSQFINNYKNWHQKVSYIKSGIRIAGCVFALWFTTYGIAILAGMLIIAEFLGIIEEYI